MGAALSEPGCPLHQSTTTNLYQLSYSNTQTLSFSILRQRESPFRSFLSLYSKCQEYMIEISKENNAVYKGGSVFCFFLQS